MAVTENLDVFTPEETEMLYKHTRDKRFVACYF